MSFFVEFLKLILILVALAAFVLLSFVGFLYFKNRNKKQLRQDCMMEDIEDDFIILDYKFLMCKEKFSNHSYVKSDENKDISATLQEEVQRFKNI